MGVISTEMYEALLLAHVPEDKAKAAAAEVAKTQDFASKSDLLELGAQLQAEMDKRFAEVDKSLAVLKFAFSGGIDHSCASDQACVLPIENGPEFGGQRLGRPQLCAWYSLPVVCQRMIVG